MTEQVDKSGVSVELATWDVSRAHFYGEAQRWVCIALPPGCEKPGFVSRLNRTMCGTQDASRINMESWAQEIEKEGINMGYARRALSKGDRICGLCNGDDACVVGSRQK